jgi:hypothetical protein
MSKKRVLSLIVWLFYQRFCEKKRCQTASSAWAQQDGSIFDTMWRIFLHHMAHFYAPRGSVAQGNFHLFSRKIKANCIPAQ